MTLSVMYRGPLSSCNYSCRYCPFAKRIENGSQLQRDKDALRRFTDWIARQDGRQWKILFTPWGESLVRSWYRDAVIELSWRQNVKSVAVQTNLSCSLAWVKKCRLDRVSFWATFHPTETDGARFLRKVMQLRQYGVRLSVGMVAVPDFFHQIIDFRRQLPADVYMWLNAQQPRSRRYTSDEVARLTEVDPHFPITVRRQPSQGKPCQSGESAFTVDGQGDMRRCHFVDEVIGNIDSPDWESALRPRPCPNRFCDCFLGKSQQRSEELLPFFGENLLERRI